MHDLATGTFQRLVLAAVGLAALASLAFAFASPAHVEDGWEYRGFFLVIAVAEMALAVWLLLRSRDPSPTSEADRRRWHSTALLGMAVAGVGVLAYVLTYVTGIQHAGHSAETIAAGPAPLDVLTKVVEVALVGVLLRVAMLTAPDDEAEAPET